MTEEQAIMLVAKIREIGVWQDIGPMKRQAMEEALRPLPFDLCNQRVEAWALMPAVDAEGAPVTRWISTPDDVLKAVGVMGARARAMLHEAVSSGRELWPSLRDVGWEIVEPDAPLPRGVGEWHANLGLPTPTGREIALALPEASKPSLDGPRRLEPVLDRIGADLRRRKDLSLRQAVARVQHPNPPAVIERAAMPPVLQEAIRAAEEASDRAVMAEQKCLAMERAYRELCEEMRDRLRDAAPDLESAQEVARELLERIVADPLGGIPTAIECFRAAVAPDLVIDGKQSRVVRGENPDPFEDGAGPLIGLRVTLRRA
jgi:hypothetical protein